MRHHLVRCAAVAAGLVLGTGALSAGGAGAALAGPVAAGTAAGPATPCSAAAPVLLPTGDLAGPAAGGPMRGCVRDILVVRRAGTAGPMVSLAMGGRRYLLPLAAAGYLGRGLDLGLFDVGALARVESGGRLPVRVTYSYGLPSLPGVTVTSRRPGSALGYLTRAGAREFGAALLRQFLADHARASYGQDGMFAGGVSLSLAGDAAPAPAPSPAFPMTTLTVTGTNLAGRPDTGDMMVVINADNAARLGPSAGVGTFDAGVAKFSVPLGHYWGIGVFFHLDPKAKTLTVRGAVLPRFTVGRGGSTVHVAERAATSKVQMITARPAEADFTAVGLVHSEATGPPVDTGFFVTPTDVSGHVAVPSLFLSPTGKLPPNLLTTVTSERLSSAPGGSVPPYVYSLAYVHRGGIGPQRFVVRPSSLATVSSRYFAAPAGPGIGAQFELPLDTPESGLGSEFLFVGYAFNAPLHDTEYFSTGPSLAWYHEYDQGLPNDNDQIEVRAFHPGQRLTENWGAYPLHPGPDVRLPGTGPGGPVVPSASRAGDTLRLDWPAFSDNVPGHTGGAAFDPGTVVSYRVDQNGTQVAAGTRTFRKAGSVVGTVTAAVSLAAARSLIGFTLDASQRARSHPLSAVTHTVWTWRSAHQSGPGLPAGWTCTPPADDTSAPPDRSCSVEPMMTLRYGVHGLALNGSAPAGRQVLAVTAGHLQLATASPVTRASVAVSFDGGKTWHTARLSGHDGSYTAAFGAPAGAGVTLRASAADAAGGSITQTIINAYQTAS